MLDRLARLIFGLLITLAACALVTGAANAQALTKPYQKWTAQEAEWLLSDSPWAQTQPGLVSSGRLDPITEAVDTTITVRLQSALPIRQALARMKQLSASYDQKSEANRALIDAKNSALLECRDCADFYVVVMSPGPGSRNGLPNFLMRASLAAAKLNVQVSNEKGETRDLVKFLAPKFYNDNATFYFPRLDAKGEPLIGPANRTLIVLFDPRIFDWKKPTLTKFKFDVAKMIVDGKLFL